MSKKIKVSVPVDAVQSGARPPKGTCRVPMYPPRAQAFAQELSRLIDAGGEQSPLAYALLSRLAVFWAVPDMADSEREDRLADLIRHMGHVDVSTFGPPPVFK